MKDERGGPYRERRWESGEWRVEKGTPEKKSSRTGGPFRGFAFGRAACDSREVDSGGGGVDKCP
jgi:hypothetical protein